MYSYRLVNLSLYVSTLTNQTKEEATEINILSLIGSYHGKVLVLIGIIILIILSILAIIIILRYMNSFNKTKINIITNIERNTNHTLSISLILFSSTYEYISYSSSFSFNI